MIQIPLTQGQVAYIDDSDWDLVKSYKWHAAKQRGIYYAHTAVRKPDGKRIMLKMHRLIMNETDPKVFIDHKDHDGLNNQQYNLRRATNQQNQQNQRPRGKTSSYKGVSWDKVNKRWRASMNINGKYCKLGSFATEQEAAEAYNKAAKIHHGEFS